MAHSERVYSLLTGRLGAGPGLSEKKMFGGVCFMLNGNMLCGSMPAHGMVRVGKAREAEALKLNGVEPLSLTGRRMGGLVQIDEDSLADPAIADPLFNLAFAFVGALPAK